MVVLAVAVGALTAVPLTAQAAQDGEDQQHDANIQDDIGEVKAKRHSSRDLIEEKIPERHQGPVIIGDALRALKGPDI